jgi:hypothetical protein
VGFYSDRSYLHNSALLTSVYYRCRPKTSTWTGSLFGGVVEEMKSAVAYKPYFPTQYDVENAASSAEFLLLQGVIATLQAVKVVYQR